MFYDGFVNFLNFIISSADQPQKYLVFAVSILLGNVLLAVLDWQWGRGIGFTAGALLAGAFYVYLSVVLLRVIQHDLALELAEPESWASLGVSLGMVYWYLLELPVLLGLGIGAVVLAALSRQRGWIIGNGVALGLTVLAPLLAVWIIPGFGASTDIFNPLSVHERDVREAQAHLAFVVGLFAIQLLYLAYGVWRIWHTRGMGSRSRPATSLPLV